MLVMTDLPGFPPMEWASRAACRSHKHPEWWFPPAAHPTVVATAYGNARKVCNGCPVKAECLADAMREGTPNGMWGGLTPKDRERLRREQDIKRRYPQNAGSGYPQDGGGRNA